jgi:prepilin-type N-terminal cleavage/methylation domain-containing protein/prepilin-type processing-associated H-X9-DG protein
MLQRLRWPTNSFCRRSRGAGFSLVELLVVIGIIALLIAMLMPALSAAREHAQRVKCLATLRGISQAADLHVLNHYGYLPAAGHHWDLIGGQLDPKGLADEEAKRYTYYLDNGTRRPAPITVALALQMGLDIRTDSRANLEEDLKRSDLRERFHCPSQIEPMRGLSERGPGWSAPLEYSSYVFNEALLGRREFYPTRSEPILGNVAKVKHSSQVFLAADGRPRGGLDGEVLVISNMDDHDTFSSFVEHIYWGPEFARGHLDYPRHGYRINVVFVDGHAETLYMTDGGLRAIGVSQGIYD